MEAVVFIVGFILSIVYFLAQIRLFSIDAQLKNQGRRLENVEKLLGDILEELQRGRIRPPTH